MSTSLDIVRTNKNLVFFKCQHRVAAVLLEEDGCSLDLLDCAQEEAGLAVVGAVLLLRWWMAWAAGCSQIKEGMDLVAPGSGLCYLGLEWVRLQGERGEEVGGCSIGRD